MLNEAKLSKYKIEEPGRGRLQRGEKRDGGRHRNDGREGCFVDWIGEVCQSEGPISSVVSTTASTPPYPTQRKTNFN